MSLQVGFERVFLACAQWCCRWRARRYSVPRRPPPATATSTACGLWAVGNRPTRSTSPQLPRQRCVAWPKPANACGPGPPRTLLPPAAGGSAPPCRCWYRAPPQSGCHSILRRLPRRRPSTGCVPWSAAGQSVCRHVSALRAAPAHHRSASPHISSRQLVSRSRCISAIAEPSIRKSTGESMTGGTSFAPMAATSLHQLASQNRQRQPRSHV